MSKRATPSRIASKRLRNSRSEAGTLAARNSRKKEMNMRQPSSPSPAPREREGPVAKRWEGEGAAGGTTLTRLALLATLSRGVGEGLGPRSWSSPSTPVQKGEALEQMHVLLVLQQRAVQRRDQLFGVAGAQYLGRDVLDEEQLEPIEEFRGRGLFLQARHIANV